MNLYEKELTIRFKTYLKMIVCTLDIRNLIEVIKSLKTIEYGNLSYLCLILQTVKLNLYIDIKIKIYTFL